ncbi:MAG: BLUF domain-containing protein [Rhodocyclaceae bacterium]|nr:BLUF domain-containing protein [Rhodocyclaceae bacterium]MBX3669926.1 BLUF domain-containing protein [Rhodocyclaceae bacterium]
MSLEAIVYVSTASWKPNQGELESLLASARARNLEYAVTGALIYHEATFIQYFEGPPLGMDVVYGHIRHSTLHHGIIELLRQPVAERAFPNWTMGFTVSTDSPLLELATEKFLATLRNLPPDRSGSDGRELVLEFWRNFRKGR